MGASIGSCLFVVGRWPEELASMDVATCTWTCTAPASVPSSIRRSHVIQVIAYSSKLYLVAGDNDGNAVAAALEPEGISEGSLAGRWSTFRLPFVPREGCGVAVRRRVA